MATRNMSASGSSAAAREGEALRATKDFIHHMYNSEFEWCANRMTKDFVWIGTQKNLYATSKEEFSRIMSGDDWVAHNGTVTDEEYMVVYCTDRMCCVVGKFLILTPPDDEKISAHWNRCTLVWHRSGKRNLLGHLHVSAPVDYVEEGDSYPISAGTETYRYMRSLRRLGSSRKSVSLYDVDGTVHWVHPSQIIYLEANRKRTIVHCMTKNIVVPAVIRDTIEMVDNKIMRVHRSYAVNRDHVVELKAGRLLLDDGTSIAIPAKRIADVRADLTGR